MPTFNNGESAASVRTKINAAIDKVDGTSPITSADINGGTIDGVTIGGSSAGAITGTTITGSSFVTTGDMTFGDNDKAIFGAGSDLEIYHDGSNSYVHDKGTGNLLLRGTNLQLRGNTANELYVRCVEDGQVDLYYDNAVKLTTTATGVDVTGTVTADGLTVDTNTLYVDSTNNRVGIGTSNPAQDLDIASGNPGIRLSDTVEVSYSNLVWDGNLSALFINADSGNQIANSTMRFLVDDTERARIDSSGNVLISSTNTDPALNDVANAIALRADGRISARGTDNFSTMSLSRGGTDGRIIGFHKGTTLVGEISVTTTATSYNTSSDYRLKEDVQPMVGASDRVLSLNPVNFAWKVDGSRTDGFLAHEAQAVVPEAVTGEKDGEEMQAIDQSKLVPLLTAALQEALKRIEALEAQLNP